MSDRILIVDDEQDIADLIEVYLTMLSFSSCSLLFCV